MEDIKNFCNCNYCKGNRCHYWTSLGRKITGYSTPSWCPKDRLKKYFESVVKENFK